ncbi:MAG: response regulator [Acidobacteriaceae bacterium]
MAIHPKSVQKHVVLCVDDEQPGLSLRKVVLEKCGYEVLTASNSSEALTLFQAHKVSMVIADHLLGNESGIELAGKLKRISPEIPIVLLAGAPPERMENIDCFILKGEPISYVLDILKDLLER